MSRKEGRRGLGKEEGGRERSRRRGGRKTTSSEATERQTKSRHTAQYDDCGEYRLSSSYHTDELTSYVDRTYVF